MRPARAGDAVDTPPTTRIESILLATDASTASRAAECHAIDLAARLGARLLVLSVVSGGPSVRETRQLAVEAIVQRARAVGADARGMAWDGDPGEAIVDAAQAELADLIVVGTHGRGAVGRLFLGSVSNHVIRHARCPVMVVRPTRVAAPAGAAPIP
jgi:nucleotide-binding universal stress UspA family protein